MVRWRRAGVEEAFLHAVQPAADLVYNLACRLAVNSTDAEDLVQETYLRAWQAWSRGTRPRRVEPWLATICLNVGRDRARWASRHPEALTSDVVSKARAAPDTADLAVDRLEIEAALAGLPEPQRIAVLLSDVCGLTARDVAQVTGCPLGTALARVHRGRRALAARLDTTDGAEMGRRDQRGGGSHAPRP